tara:strand:- start:288 stop:554 length:267 start_codon:yes stop_codon:yes gene_type:complete
MDNDSTEKLIPFLRNLADGIENKTIAPQQLQSIGEFFMSYQFREQAIKDSDTSIEEETQFNKEEIIKFVSLGWYVYQVLLKKDRLPET